MHSSVVIQVLYRGSMKEGLWSSITQKDYLQGGPCVGLCVSPSSRDCPPAYQQFYSGIWAGLTSKIYDLRVVLYFGSFDYHTVDAWQPYMHTSRPRLVDNALARVKLFLRFPSS